MLDTQPVEDETLVILESDNDDEQQPPLDPYFFADTPDEKLRCFIVETMATDDVDGKILVENMQAIFDWVKTGAVAAPRSRPRHVKPVDV